MPRPLNPRQLKFVELYLKGLSATEAYVKAGYKGKGRSAENGASQLLGNIGVKEAIAKATGEAIHTAELNAGYVIAGLKKEANFYGDGAQHTARIKAYELLGKTLKMWDDEKPKDEGADKGSAVEHVTRLLAVFGARKPDSGAGGGTAGGALAGNPVVPERGAAEPGVPE